MLVLAPTRELATQIQEQAVKFGRASGLSSTVSGVKCSPDCLVALVEIALLRIAKGGLSEKKGKR